MLLLSLLFVSSLLGQVEEPVLNPRLPVKVTVQDVMFPVFVRWERVGIIRQIEQGRGFPTGDSSVHRLPRGALRLYVRDLPRYGLVQQEPEDYVNEVQYEIVGKYRSPWTAYAHELPAVDENDEVIIHCKAPLPAWHSAIVRPKEHQEYPILVTLLKPRFDDGMSKNSLDVVITSPQQIQYFEQYGYPNSMLQIARYGPKACARQLAEHFLGEMKKEKSDHLSWGRTSRNHIRLGTVLIGSKPNPEYGRMSVDELAVAIEECMHMILRQCPPDQPALKHELRKAQNFIAENLEQKEE